jgi:hypothetical protein
MALGMPLAVLASYGTSRVIQPAPQTEVNALSRVFLRRSGSLLATSATLLSLIYILWQLFAVSFGRRMGIEYSLPGEALTAALAIVPVAIALWLASAGALQNDVALAGETRTSAAMRRAHFYLIAAACLAGSGTVRPLLRWSCRWRWMLFRPWKSSSSVCRATELERRSCW